MIKVLIVDDSLIMQETLAFILGSDPDFKIVGYANNGEEAIELVKKTHPDVITMDWQMPVLNGQQATQKIMETIPTPIVVVTGSLAANDVTVSFSLMEAGALAIVKKPHGINHPAYKNESSELIQTLKLMSEIKLVRRIGNRSKEVSITGFDSVKKVVHESGIKLVAIGASTGGPIALQKLLTALPVNFPVPILIVQHISQGFTAGFAEWLMNTTNFPVHVAFHGEMALPGHIYIAPEHYHMGVEQGPKIVLSQHGLENGLRPAVAWLFRTCAINFGSHAVGVLLTGMGRDGADELKLMKETGAITFAQDQKSSVVHGMPGEAIKLDAATHILSPEEIARNLKKLLLG